MAGPKNNAKSPQPKHEINPSRDRKRSKQEIWLDSLLKENIQPKQSESFLRAKNQQAVMEKNKKKPSWK